MPTDPVNLSLDQWRSRGLLPTTLTSAELSQIDAALMRQAVVSARTAMVEHLDVIAQQIDSMLSGETGRAEAILSLKESLKSLNYQASPDAPDLSSYARRKLIVETNTTMAQSAGQVARGMSAGALAGNPCWELIRGSRAKTKERNWKERWVIACKASGDEDALRVFKATGRMIARKTSGAWTSLGDRGLFPDALGNNFAPFAFGSHMVLKPVGFRECEKLGLIKAGEKQAPKSLEFQAAEKAPQSIKTASLREALAQLMDDSGVLDKTPLQNRLRNMQAILGGTRVFTGGNRDNRGGKTVARTAPPRPSSPSPLSLFAPVKNSGVFCV